MMKTNGDGNDFKQALARDLDALAQTAQEMAGLVRSASERAKPAQLARLMIATDKASAALRKHLALLAK